MTSTSRILRKRLIVTVAAAPLLALAGMAHAETDIATGATAPVATSTANAGAPDDVVLSAGSSLLITAAGPGLLQDSNNSVTNNGTLRETDVDGAIGIQSTGGRTGDVANDSQITFDTSQVPADTDGDGDLDTPLAIGTNRTGISIEGPLTGTVTNGVGGDISIQGNDSVGIAIKGAVTGGLTNTGIIGVTGDNATAISIAAPVSGDVNLGGTVTIDGLNGKGMTTSADIGGELNISGNVISTGYRTYARSTDPAVLSKLDADDLLLGGPGISIGGDVAGGVLVSEAPAKVDSTDTTTDSDGDGVVDSAQTSGTVGAYGSAPGMLIGSDTRDVAIGQVTKGASGAGLIINGVVGGNGAFDGFAANGLQIGTDAGKAVSIAGGVINNGQVSAFSFVAPATAVELKSGSQVGQWVNNGTINATIQGSAQNATGLIDRSGNLTNIVNNGVIRASVIPGDGSVPTGVATAIDLSNAKSGVTITQDAPAGAATGASTVTTSFILGGIKLGAFDDVIDVQSGAIGGGTIDFGAGANALKISGGSLVNSKVTNSGTLSVDVSDGQLRMGNDSGVQNITTLNVGAKSSLIFTADPDATTVGSVNVDTATFAAGAQVGLTVSRYLDKTSTFTVLTANTLNNGGLVDVDDAASPYLFTSNAKVDGNSIDVTVRRRTPQELGFTAGEAGSADGVYQTLASSTGPIAAALLQATTQYDLLALYDQLMPDQGDESFNAMETSAMGLAEAVRQRPDPGASRYGPDSLWIRETDLGSDVKRGDTLGGSTKGFGFDLGYEAMGFGDGGALGFTLSYMDAQNSDDSAQVGEYNAANNLAVGAYWRGQDGGLSYAVGGQVGRARYKGVRVFVAPSNSIYDIANSRWGGTNETAYGAVAYEKDLGRFYLRPSLDGVYVRADEDAHSEKGAGTDFNLAIAQRRSSRFAGQAMMAVGGIYGTESWWRPEVRLGYRFRTGGSVGETTAHFLAGGPDFTLPGIDGVNAPVVGLALRAGSSLSYVSIEANAELDSDQTRYDLNLFGRVMF